MTVPPAERWFEDYHVGMVDEFGEITVTADEIVEFATRYDPQPMHTIAKELIASGWHTASMVMRLFVEHYLSKVATLPSPGLDELRWLRPVRPGDVLRVRVTVTEARRSRSKPDRARPFSQDRMHCIRWMAKNIERFSKVDEQKKLDPRHTGRK